MVIVYIYYGRTIHILWSLYTYTMVVVYIYFWLFVVDLLPGMAALLELRGAKVWINSGFHRLLKKTFRKSACAVMLCLRAFVSGNGERVFLLYPKSGVDWY
jgi:hypothetical protein